MAFPRECHGNSDLTQDKARSPSAQPERILLTVVYQELVPRVGGDGRGRAVGGLGLLTQLQLVTRVGAGGEGQVGGWSGPPHPAAGVGDKGGWGGAGEWVGWASSPSCSINDIAVQGPAYRIRRCDPVTWPSATHQGLIQGAQ